MTDTVFISGDLQSLYINGNLVYGSGPNPGPTPTPTPTPTPNPTPSPTPVPPPTPTPEPPPVAGLVVRNVEWLPQKQYQEPQASLQQFEYRLTDPVSGELVQLQFGNIDAPNLERSGLLIDIKTLNDSNNKPWLKVSELPGSDNLFRSFKITVGGIVQSESDPTAPPTGIFQPWRLN